MFLTDQFTWTAHLPFVARSSIVPRNERVQLDHAHDSDQNSPVVRIGPTYWAHSSAENYCGDQPIPGIEVGLLGCL